MPQLKKAIKKILPNGVVDAVTAMRLHKQSCGSFPDLLNPKTFNEKIVYRKIFDRRAFLRQLTDKYEARQYAEKKLGAEILPKLYFVTNDPSYIPFSALPDKFVVKPTHGSGWVRIVHDKSKLDREELIETCRQWLRSDYYEMSREWVYKNIEPRIMVEEYIDDGHDGAPNDYKLLVFDGKVQLVQVDAMRFTPEHSREIYDLSWKKFDVWYGAKTNPGGVERPKHLDKMVRAAEILGEGIDFIRVDFYHTPRQIYFGEMTMTPANGLGIFKPHDFDRFIGDFWKIKTRKQDTTDF